MSLKVIDKYAKSFVSEDKIAALNTVAATALETVVNKNGAGNDFLGWVDLPVNYDKEEFARIKIAAEKIEKAGGKAEVI